MVWRVSTMASNSRLDSDFNKHSTDSQQESSPHDKREYSEYNARYEDKICLECGQPLKSGRVAVKPKGEGIVQVCPVCTTEGQIIKFKRLAESDSFQNFIEEMEIRRGEQV